MYIYIIYIYTCLYIRQEPPRVFAVQRQCPNQPEQLLNLSEEPCLYKHKIETTMVPKTLHHSGLCRTYTFTGISSLQSCQEGVHARRRACKQQAFIRIRIHMHTFTNTYTYTCIFMCTYDIVYCSEIATAIWTPNQSTKQGFHERLKGFLGFAAFGTGGTALAAFGTLDSALEPVRR